MAIDSNFVVCILPKGIIETSGSSSITRRGTSSSTIFPEKSGPTAGNGVQTSTTVPVTQNQDFIKCLIQALCQMLGMNPPAGLENKAAKPSAKPNNNCEVPASKALKPLIRGRQVAINNGDGNKITQNNNSSPLRGADGKLSRQGVDQAVIEWCKKLGIDPQVGRALQLTENPQLLDRSQVCNARGTMQCLPETQERMLEDLKKQGIDTSKLSPDEQNIAAGCNYLKKCLERACGDPELAQHYYQYGLNTSRTRPEARRLERFRRNMRRVENSQVNNRAGSTKQIGRVDGNNNQVNQTIIEQLIINLFGGGNSCQVEPDTSYTAESSESPEPSEEKEEPVQEESPPPPACSQ